MRRVGGYAVALLLLSCGGGSEAAVTLRFWAMGHEAEVVAPLVREFERTHPGIRVDLQQIPWTAAHEKLLTAYVGDATPDVAQLGNTWVPELAILHAIAPLDSLLRASPDIPTTGFFPGIWDTNVIEGRVFGIPWYVDTRLIFYRTDLLRSAGAREMPDTWAGWRQVLERLRENGGPRSFPLLMPLNEWAQPVVLALQAGSPILRDGDRYGAFTDSAFVRAFHFYVGLYRDTLAPKVANTEVANLYQDFARGMIASYITGPYNLDEFRKRLPDSLQDHWATAPMPGPDGPGVSLAGGSSLVLFRRSAHPAEAWQLIRFLSEPAQQARFFHLSGNLPARREAWQDSTLRADPKVAAFRQQLERVVPTPKVAEWELIATRITEAGERAVRGGQSEQQALATLEAQVNTILAKRRALLEVRGGQLLEWNAP
ncbi:MAG TPA: sugar ABC transporter substrate-binding protein [Gemmatimonadales bacterium]